MDKILKLKNWQVFFGLIFFPTLYYCTAEYNLHFSIFSSIELVTTFAILGLIIFFSWVLIVGLSLNRTKENPHHFNKYIFIFAVLCCVLGYGEMHLEGLNPDKTIVSEPIEIILLFLTFFGIFFTFKNVAQSLKSIEYGDKIEFRGYIVDSILFLAFPIGIWFIQPRLNNIDSVLETI